MSLILQNKVVTLNNEILTLQVPFTQVKTKLKYKVISTENK